MKKLFIYRNLITISLLLFSLLASSCSSIFPTASNKRVFVLGAGLLNYCTLPAESGQEIFLSENDSAPVFHSNKIMFQMGHEIGFYQLAEWSEPTTDRVRRLLEEKLRCAGYNILDAGSAPAGKDTLNLSFTILDFSHKADSQPGQLDLKVRVEKTLKNRRTEQIFQYSQVLASYDAEGVVFAADPLFNSFLQDFETFIKS